MAVKFYKPGTKYKKGNPLMSLNHSDNLHIMKTCARICEVRYLGERNLLISFEDGLQRELSFHANWEGITEQLNSDDFLALVGIDPVTKTLSWPNGIDLDAEILHGDFDPSSGAFFSVVSEEIISSL
jgi:hypothetical protein